MSRLSGFIAYDKEGNKIMSISWENQLIVDSRIEEYINQHSFLFDDRSKDENNIIYTTNHESFKELFLYLSNILTQDFFKRNNYLLYASVEETFYMWRDILSSIKNFFKYYDNDYLVVEVTYEYYSHY